MMKKQTLVKTRAQMDSIKLEEDVVIVMLLA